MRNHITTQALICSILWSNLGAVAESQTLQGRLEDEQNSAQEGGALRITRPIESKPDNSMPYSEKIDLREFPFKSRSVSKGVFNPFGFRTAQLEQLGIVGIRMDRKTGKVNAIFEPSDAKNYDIQIGDTVLAFNGHPWDGSNLVAEEGIGPIGTTCHITIQKPDGRILKLKIKRTAASAYLPYEGQAGINCD